MPYHQHAPGEYGGSPQGGTSVEVRACQLVRKYYHSFCSGWKYGDIHRLDRILDAEGDDVNRYKASKQADVLMLFYLFSSEELLELFHRPGNTGERPLAEPSVSG